MTFAQYENSIESGRPIELIRFVLGAETFNYTSAEDELTVDSITYTPIAITRGKLDNNPENRKHVVPFTVSGDNKFARKYIDVVPGSQAKVTLKRVQRPDFPGPETITLYEGFVNSVRFEQDGYVAKIATITEAAAISRPIPRFTFMGLCNHVVYDDGCKVDETDSTWRHVDDVLTVVDNVITVQGADGFADGFFTGGYVEFQGGLDHRLILDHTGTSLQLLLPFSTSPLGEQVTVLAGCDHQISTCNVKFHTTEDPTSNVINYGGFHFIPTRDIFRTGLK